MVLGRLFTTTASAEKVSEKLASRSRVAARNTGFLIAGDMTCKLAMILFASVLARRLGAAEFGEFVLAQVLGGIVIALADPGVSQIVYRDFATSEEPSLLIGAGALLRLAFLPVAFGSLTVLAYLLGYSSQVFSVIAVVGLAVLVLGMGENYFWIFKAASKAILVFWSRGFQSVLLLTFAIVLWKTHLSLRQVALGYLAYAILGTVFVPLLAGATGYRHRLPSLKYSAGVLRRGLPLALQALMVYVYLYADTIILSVMRTMNEVGHYQAAYRLVLSLNIIGTAFVASVFPFFVQGYASGRQGLDEIYYRSMKYLLALGFGIAMGTTMLADRIIVFFYGGGFLPSIRFLQILIWSEALIFLSFVCGGLLLALDRRWELFRQAVLAAILNLVLNLPIIYYWGALGASVTTVATEIFALCYLIWRVGRSGIRLGQRWIPDLVRVAGACASMSIILLLGEKLPLAPLIVLGGCIYFGVLFLIRFFDDVDTRLGGQMLSITRV